MQIINFWHFPIYCMFC